MATEKIPYSEQVSYFGDCSGRSVSLTTAPLPTGEVWFASVELDCSKTRVTGDGDPLLLRASGDLDMIPDASNAVRKVQLPGVVLRDQFGRSVSKADEALLKSGKYVPAVQVVRGKLQVEQVPVLGISQEAVLTFRSFQSRDAALGCLAAAAGCADCPFNRNNDSITEPLGPVLGDGELTVLEVEKILS